uniref:Uncharacterized protein n=1 Tax=Panagrellus redivivus TaxID=6233 RepID=A0A7E4UNG2_PANRE
MDVFVILLEKSIWSTRWPVERCLFNSARLQLRSQPISSPSSSKSKTEAMTETTEQTVSAAGEVTIVPPKVPSTFLST